MNTTAPNPWTQREAAWASTFLAASGFTLRSTLSRIRRPSSSFIRDHVAIIYGFDHDQFLRDRRAECAQARQLAMFLAREQTLESLPQIARAFHKRDHTTVMYSCDRVRDRCEVDPEFAEEVALVRTTIAESYEAYRAAVASDLQQAKAS